MSKKLTKKEHVSRLLAKKPDMTAQQAIDALAKKGVEINKQTFYSTRHVIRKEAAETEEPVIAQKTKATKRRRKPQRRQPEPEFEIDLQTRFALLEQQNQRLKAVIAALL